MDTIIVNGIVATPAGESRADVLIESDQIAAVGIGPAGPAGVLAEAMGDSSNSRAELRVIDAAGCYLLPGGVDPHTHLDMPFGGTVSSDDFETGTRAAAVGGTTSIVDFAMQPRGESLTATLERWLTKADGEAVIDYGFHVAVTDLTAEALEEVPRLVDRGVSSFKLFMAYKGSLMVDDATLLLMLQRARDVHALICVHAENGDVIEVLVREHLAEGKADPRYHAATRPSACEGEATGRAILLAGLAKAPLYVVHLTCREALDQVRAARDRGQEVYAETCPQYLALSVDELARPGFEGAKFVCSPPLRDRSNWDHLWAGLRTGDLEVVATDHCPFNFAGQKELGRGDFSLIPNGMPGIEHRLQLLYTLGVSQGRISMSRLVDLFATTPARLFGLSPQKGSIAPGADADIVIFDPEPESVLTAARQVQNVDYTPFEGWLVKGAVRTVLRRGEVIVDDGKFVGGPGGGRYLVRRPFIGG